MKFLWCIVELLTAGVHKMVEIEYGPHVHFLRDATEVEMSDQDALRISKLCKTI